MDANEKVMEWWSDGVMGKIAMKWRHRIAQGFSPGLGNP
jgi:hypothetical protein